MLNARNYDKRRGVESRTKVRAKNLGGRVLKTGKRRKGGIRGVEMKMAK